MPNELNTRRDELFKKEKGNSAVIELTAGFGKKDKFLVLSILLSTFESPDSVINNILLIAGFLIVVLGNPFFGHLTTIESIIVFFLIQNLE